MTRARARPLFLLALPLELDEVLGSSLGCCRSHRAILAANIMLPEADVEPRENEGGRLRRMGNGKIEMRKRENNSFYLFCRAGGRVENLAAPLWRNAPGAFVVSCVTKY